MCEDDEFTFRECYSATKDECLKSADIAARACMIKIKKPDVANLPEAEGRAAFGKWGLQVGYCAEQAYHEKNKAKFRSGDKKCAENLKAREENYAKNK